MTTDFAARPRWRRRATGGFVLASVAAILVATLWPAEPRGEVQWSDVACILCEQASLADVTDNVLLFIPLGVALALYGYAPVRALGFAAPLSFCVEAAQFVIPGRDPSVSDLVFNSLGALLGAAVVCARDWWLRPPPRVAGRLCMLSAAAAATALTATAVLLTPSFPDTVYFASSSVVDSSTLPLRIGANTYPAEHFEGRIDEVRVYNRALGEIEIRADMEIPVGSGPRSSTLVAAYSFDAASPVLPDVSGHGNHGHIAGATWTREGKFGGALVFDGENSAVVVPHAPSLSLGGAMTLEAWVYPTAPQRGWRAIIQKDIDPYFLFAGSDAGTLIPAGGGTFGGTSEHVHAPRALPVNAWTHLAVTYDGSRLNLYINGRLGGSRVRWYPGRVIDVTLGGVDIRPGAHAESAQLRERLLAGATLRVRAVAGDVVPSEARLVALHDAFHRPVATLAAHREDLVFRIRTRAAALKLESPAIRARGVLRGIAAGDDVTLAISSPTGGRCCVTVNATETCGRAFAVARGWALFFDSQVPAAWSASMLDGTWMAALVFPIGFWARARRESVVAGVLLLVGIAVGYVVTGVSLSAFEVAAGALGVLAGVGVRGRGRPAFTSLETTRSWRRAADRACAGALVERPDADDSGSAR